MSDMVATAYGSLAMMTSVLVSPDGIYEYEAAHGTVQNTITGTSRAKKPLQTQLPHCFAWTGALRKRANSITCLSL